jgi:HTH-type transcriptional regulator, glycine betaine synthesis regulator
MARTAPTSAQTESDTDSGLVLAGDRADDVVAFERSVVNFFVEAAHLLGVPKSVAAIYGIVFASATPVSFAEIEERLAISKGSVSQGLRVLRDMGALQEVSGKEDRVERFVPDLELRKLVQRFIEHRLQEQLEAGKSRLHGLAELVPTSDEGDEAMLRKRLKHLQTWHDKARAVLPVIKTFLALTKP